jgi:Phage integrase family
MAAIATNSCGNSARTLQVWQQLEPPGKGRKISRNIEVWAGDFNQNVEKILGGGKITQKEATFCLLDQRTFECHWSTVRRSFATLHHEAGVPARQIQQWLGHSDLTTTLRYLAISDDRSEKTRNRVNNSFAFLLADPQDCAETPTA